MWNAFIQCESELCDDSMCVVFPVPHRNAFTYTYTQMPYKKMCVHCFSVQCSVFTDQIQCIRIYMNYVVTRGRYFLIESKYNTHICIAMHEQKSTATEKWNDKTWNLRLDTYIYLHSHSPFVVVEWIWDEWKNIQAHGLLGTTCHCQFCVISVYYMKRRLNS